MWLGSSLNHFALKSKIYLSALQSAYAELYLTDLLWPDFGPAELKAALEDYAQRERRFGGI